MRSKISTCEVKVIERMGDILAEHTTSTLQLFSEIKSGTVKLLKILILLQVVQTIIPSYVNGQDQTKRYSVF